VLLLLGLVVGFYVYRRKHEDSSLGAAGMATAAGGGRHEAATTNPAFAQPTYDVPNIPSASTSASTDAVFGGEYATIASVQASSGASSTHAEVYHLQPPGLGSAAGGESASFYEVTAGGFGLEAAAAADGNNEYDVGAPLQTIRPGKSGGGSNSAPRRSGSVPPPETTCGDNGLQAGSAAGAKCQRPSPNGGTCKNRAHGGGRFCRGHTCSIDGCADGKSSTAVACARHSSMERDGSEGVDEQGNIVHHVSCGGNFYELPLTNGGGVVYDVAPDASGGAAPSPMYVAAGGATNGGGAEALYATSENATAGAVGAGGGDGADAGAPINIKLAAHAHDTAHGRVQVRKLTQPEPALYEANLDSARSSQVYASPTCETGGSRTGAGTSQPDYVTPDYVTPDYAAAGSAGTGTSGDYAMFDGGFGDGGGTPNGFDRDRNGSVFHGFADGDGLDFDDETDL
jgi:hypothetical protein